jgi:hypothetical protein
MKKTIFYGPTLGNIANLFLAPAPVIGVVYDSG